MQKIASCKVGRNPIVNGIEYQHTNYSVITPDPNPCRMYLIKGYLKGKSRFAITRKKKQKSLPCLRREKETLNQKFQVFYFKILKLLPNERISTTHTEEI